MINQTWPTNRKCHEMDPCGTIWHEKHRRCEAPATLKPMRHLPGQENKKEGVAPTGAFPYSPSLRGGPLRAGYIGLCLQRASKAYDLWGLTDSLQPSVLAPPAEEAAPAPAQLGL